MTEGNETTKRETSMSTSTASGGSQNPTPAQSARTSVLFDTGNRTNAPIITVHNSAGNNDMGTKTTVNRNPTKSQAPSSSSSSPTSSSGSASHRPTSAPMSDVLTTNSGSDPVGPSKSPSYISLSAFGSLSATISRTFTRSPYKSSSNSVTSPASHLSSSSASAMSGGLTEPDDASRRASIVSSMSMKHRQQQLAAEEEANRGMTLSYRFKNLTTCPVSEWNATDNITSIMLSNNCLTAIPDELCNLPFLRTLSLSTNELTAINPNIVNLITLQTLNLSANQLTTAAVDEVDWSSMPSLRALYLVKNKLTAFPKSVLASDIETLSLSDNLIDTIPPEINTMTQLQWLGLSNNKISSLDPLFTLRQLSGVTIVGNLFVETDSLKRRLRHLTRTMRLSAQESCKSPLEAMSRARTMTQQLERQLVRELARHAVISPSPPSAVPSSPLVVAGSPFNVFRPLSPQVGVSSPWSPQSAGASPGSAGSSGRFTPVSRTTFAAGKTVRGSGTGSGSVKLAREDIGLNAGAGTFGGVGVSRMAREMSLEKSGMHAKRGESSSFDSFGGARSGSPGGVGESSISAGAKHGRPSGRGSPGEELLKLFEPPQKLTPADGSAALHGNSSMASDKSETLTVGMTKSVETPGAGS